MLGCFFLLIFSWIFDQNGAKRVPKRAKGPKKDPLRKSMDSLRWRAYPPTRIKSLRRIVAPSHSRSVALSLRCEVAPSQSSLCRKRHTGLPRTQGVPPTPPHPRGTLGARPSEAIPSGGLFRVDGYSEWMAICLATATPI